VLVASNPGGVSRSVSGETPKLASPPAPPPPPKPRAITSNAGRTVYRCEPQGADSPKYIEKGKADYKQERAVYGDTFGLNISVTDVLGGIRTDETTKAAVRPGIPIRTSFEVRNIGDDTFVIRTQVYPEPYANLYAMEQVVPDSEKEIDLRKTISRMPGVNITTCKLL
jgi:hypothetical protein